MRRTVLAHQAFQRKPIVGCHRSWWRRWHTCAVIHAGDGRKHAHLTGGAEVTCWRSRFENDLTRDRGPQARDDHDVVHIRGDDRDRHAGHFNRLRRFSRKGRHVLLLAKNEAVLPGWNVPHLELTLGIDHGEESRLAACNGTPSNELSVCSRQRTALRIRHVAGDVKQAQLTDSNIDSCCFCAGLHAHTLCGAFVQRAGEIRRDEIHPFLLGLGWRVGRNERVASRIGDDDVFAGIQPPQPELTEIVGR